MSIEVVIMSFNKNSSITKLLWYCDTIWKTTQTNTDRLDIDRNRQEIKRQRQRERVQSHMLSFVSNRRQERTLVQLYEVDNYTNILFRVHIRVYVLKTRNEESFREKRLHPSCVILLIQYNKNLLSFRLFTHLSYT